MRVISRLRRGCAARAATVVRRRPASTVAATARPAGVEAMEERVLFATFLVTTTADSGTGSLRAAMQKANSSTGADVIQFRIGTGLKTIAPLSSLPHLTGPTTIDGSTQGGYAGKPLIEIRGDRAGTSTTGLVLRGGAGTVKGLIINRFGANGVMLLSKGGNTLKNCYIGTDASGNAAAGNKQKGIIVQSSGNTLGGTATTDRLVISGNGQSGVQFYTSAASGNRMLGSYVGTNAAGTAAVRNVATGVSIYQAANNTIGGTTSGARNVISGNGQNGIVVLGTGAKFNTILGNYVGTNAAGTARLGNAHYGIEISQPNNTVGGTTAGARNVISGNKYSGVVLWLASGSYNKVQGNYIGTDYTGKLDLGNSWRGIDVSSGSGNNLIGGATSAERNVISGNEQDGVRVYQGTNNRIQGNYIGVGSDGTKALGNGGDGCRLVQTKYCTVQSNRIGYNGGYAVHNGTSTGTKVTSNTLVSDVLFGVRQT
jgi:titin